MKNSMHFVYYGHSTPDNYDSPPQYRIKECTTDNEVLRLYEEWLEEGHVECQECHFRVFSGTERHLEPREKVTKYELI